MNGPRYYSPKLEHLKVESLRLQRQLLNVLHSRHQHWLNSTDDPEIQKQHHEIAGLIEQMGSHYNQLLKSLQEPRNGGTGQ